MQQILNELGELRGIKTALQTLSAKLDTLLRQVGASGERDPGDAVPPGVAVQSAALFGAAGRGHVRDADGRTLRLVAEDKANARRLVGHCPRRRASAPRRIGVPHRELERFDPNRWI
jgi:hypothetical protein